jgi:hypothetical protein
MLNNKNPDSLNSKPNVLVIGILIFEFVLSLRAEGEAISRDCHVALPRKGSSQ